MKAYISVTYNKTEQMKPARRRSIDGIYAFGTRVAPSQKRLKKYPQTAGGYFKASHITFALGSEHQSSHDKCSWDICSFGMDPKNNLKLLENSQPSWEMAKHK